MKTNKKQKYLCVPNTKFAGNNIPADTYGVYKNVALTSMQRCIDVNATLPQRCVSAGNK